MKINKYINAFIATAIMAVGGVSCTNDDTVDSKSLYTIDIVTEGLNDTEMADFKKVVQSKTFGEDVAEADRVNFGLYSSYQYAEKSFDAFAQSHTLDSIINVYADENNKLEFTAQAVLKEGDRVIKTSPVMIPTVDRFDYLLSIVQVDGQLDPAQAEEMAAMTSIIYGTEPGKDLELELTPAYAKNHYMKVLSKHLEEEISTLVPSSNAFEDFGEFITLANLDSLEDVNFVAVQPYCNYAVWYEVEQGSLSTEQKEQLEKDINLALFNAASVNEAAYDKRQGYNHQKAVAAYWDRLLAYNYTLQENVINETAGSLGITDFAVTMHLSAADDIISPIEKNYLIEGCDTTYTPHVQTAIYSIEYELAEGSLSAENKRQAQFILNTVMSGNDMVAIRVLEDGSPIYKQNAKRQFVQFLTEATPFDCQVNKIAQYIVEKTKTLDFAITFKLVDDKHITYDKITYKANEGWNVGK